MKKKENEVKELLEKAYDLMEASKDKFIGLYVGEDEHISSYASGSMDNVSAIVAATVAEAFDADNEGNSNKTFYGNAIVEGVCKLISIPDEIGLRVLRKITAAMMVATFKKSINDKFGIDVDKEGDDDHSHDCENCPIHDKCPLDDAIAWRRKKGNKGGGRNNRRQKNNKKHDECCN